MTAANQAVLLSYVSQDAEVARRIVDALRAAGVEACTEGRGLHLNHLHTS